MLRVVYGKDRGRSASAGCINAVIVVIVTLGHSWFAFQQRPMMPASAAAASESWWSP